MKKREEVVIKVYDLDSTLRDTSCADHLLPTDLLKAENWVCWNDYVVEHGTRIEGVCNSYAADCADSSKVVWICTSSQFGTLDWLDKVGLPHPAQLFERAAGDNRSPTEYKAGFLEDYGSRIHSWIDDSEEVCEWVRENYFHIAVNHVTPPNEKGMKQDGEKPRYDLLPPYAIDTMCKVLTFGAKKYSPDNWKKVERVRYVAAALRHIFALLRGETYDSETGLHHGAHAMCCLSFIVEKDETKKLE